MDPSDGWYLPTAHNPQSATASFPVELEYLPTAQSEHEVIAAAAE